MGNTKLNRNAENILKMLKSTAPEEMAKWIDVILDDLASTVDNRAVAEYHFIDFKSHENLASACYVTTPQKGEFIKIGENCYEVLSVLHTFKRATEAGKILVMKVDKTFLLD